jgi:mRNA-degrading endonuclease RelE of RelBE toxin-antitoxin system
MRIITTPQFTKDFKQLSKKYPSLANDLRQLQVRLLDNPTQGIPLGDDCYKVRLAITSKGKGKSGGGRVITCVQIINDTIHLVTLYDKSDIENVNHDFLKDIINIIKNRKK